MSSCDLVSLASLKLIQTLFLLQKNFYYLSTVNNIHKESVCHLQPNRIGTFSQYLRQYSYLLFQGKTLMLESNWLKTLSSSVFPTTHSTANNLSYNFYLSNALLFYASETQLMLTYKQLQANKHEMRI